MTLSLRSQICARSCICHCQNVVYTFFHLLHIKVDIHKHVFHRRIRFGSPNPKWISKLLQTYFHWHKWSLPPKLKNVSLLCFISRILYKKGHWKIVDILLVNFFLSWNGPVPIQIFKVSQTILSYIGSAQHPQAWPATVSFELIFALIIFQWMIGNWLYLTR